MDLEPRTTAPAHATGAVEFVPLSALAADTTFQLREDGDVSPLAASMGRLGQLVPLEVRSLPGQDDVAGAPRYQVVCGFRRLAALRLLLRERALVRVHRALSDEDAWALALGEALLAEPLDRTALTALRARVAAGGATAWAEELIDEALVRAPVEPELRERFYAFITEGDVQAEPAPDADAGAAEIELPSGSGADPIMDADTDTDTDTDTDIDTDIDTDTDTGTGTDAAADAAEEVEMTPEELAADLAGRLYQVNADLAVAYEAWSALPEDGRRQIVEQARWIAELLPWLEGDAP